jgi:hypothetical protein
MSTTVSDAGASPGVHLGRAHSAELGADGGGGAVQSVRDVGTRYAWMQVDDPVYVVEFGPARGASQPERWRLTGVDDVLEVFEWAGREQRGRTASVSVEIEDGGGFTLVRLTPERGLRTVAGW